MASIDAAVVHRTGSERHRGRRRAVPAPFRRVARSGRFLLLASTVIGAVWGATTVPVHAQQGAAEPPEGAESDGQGPIRLEGIDIPGEAAGGDGFVVDRVEGATKTDTPILEVPQVINVVPRAQMDAQGVSSVSEALRYTPGVLTEANGFDVRYDWFWIRGFNSYGVTWLDGLALAGDPVNYATPSIDPYALERIEVIKGPASVLYGSTVPGGLINQVSKRPQATPHGEVSVMTSNYGGFRGAIDVTGPLTEDGAWLYRFTGLGENMHTQIDMERDRRIMLAPSLTWNPSQDTSLTVYGYYQRDRDIFSPRFYPAYGTLLPNPAGQIPRDVFLADPNADEFNRDYYAVGYELSHRFDETWAVHQSLRYGHAEQDMFLALVNPAFAFRGSPSNVLNRVSAVADDELTSFNVDSRVEAGFRTGPATHTALFGVDYLRATSDTNFGNSAFGDPRPPPIDYLDPTYGEDITKPAFQRSGLQKQSQVGLYLQDQVRYDRWVGTAGLRYDMSDIETTDRIAGTPPVTTSDTALTGRVGLTYLFESGVAPYASYTTSFLPVLGTDSQGDPFDAQTAAQYEIGIKYEPPGGRGLVTLSLFHLTMDKALTPDPADPRFDVQSGRQRIRGIEIEGRYALRHDTDVLASYAYSDSKVLDSSDLDTLGREMLRVPRHQASLWVSHRPDPVPGLALSAGIRGTTSYHTDSTYLEDLKIPGRALVDFGAAYDLGALSHALDGATLQVNVANLFDHDYVSHCLNITGGSCNYGAGRTITASLKYAW